LTYSDLGERLGVSAEAARQKAIRYRWPRQTANDGKAQVRVDLDEMKVTPSRKAREPADARPTAEQTPVEPPADVRMLAALEEHINTLKAMVAKAEETASREREQANTERIRADGERGRADAERARADELIRRLEELRDTQAARRADTEQQLVDLKSLVDQLRRPWWKRLVG
jgi:chromosome segregation ATPase